MLNLDFAVRPLYIPDMVAEMKRSLPAISIAELSLLQLSNELNVN
jgi:hypothetical protein